MAASSYMLLTKFRQKFFYFPSEISKIKEDALINAQCELEREYEQFEDEKENFETKKDYETQQMTFKLTSLNVYMKDPSRKTMGIELQYAEHWDSYTDKDSVYKHITNQLVKKMESSVPF